MNGKLQEGIWNKSMVFIMNSVDENNFEKPETFNK